MKFAADTPHPDERYTNTQTHSHKAEGTSGSHSELMYFSNMSVLSMIKLCDAELWYSKFMRKIIALEFISLDGVIQAPGGPDEDTSDNFKYGGWTVPFADEFSGKVMVEQMAGEYDLLLGRKTYDIFAGFWPEHTNDWPQVNKITKYAVSRTLTKPAWENTVILKDGTAIKELKDSDGPALQVYGSSDLMQTLLKLGLVDELWLKIFPVTLGDGKRLFGKGTIPATFDLFESKISPKGVIVASYKRAGKVETGSF